MSAQRHPPASSAVSRELLLAQVRVPERPALAPTVELLGPVPESGFAEPQWLLRRDGQFLQVTALLYRVLTHCTGEQSLPEIAHRVTEESAWVVTPELVERILQTKLIPLGLLDTGEASPPSRSRGKRSALQVQLRMKMLGPRQIEPLTGLLQHLYTPVVLLPALLLIAAAHLWLYLVHGVGHSITLALHTPGMLLLVLGVLLVSIGVHELGHAAALRYGGGVVRGIGVGLYLIYPAFYTDTTDSYRLGRWGKVRTDLGGFYFHLLFALLLMGLVQLTGQEALLAVVVLINADIVRQLLPFARFDGYWALVDLTGMPDFFSQLLPFVRTVVPGPWQGGVRLPALRPWVRAVFAGYLLLALPALAGLFGLLLWRLPTMLGILGTALLFQGTILLLALHQGALLLALAAGVQLLMLGSEVVGVVYLLLLTLVRPLLGLLERLHPRPRSQRAATSALAAAIALALFLASAQALLMPGLLSALPPLPATAGQVASRHHLTHPRLVGGQSVPSSRGAGGSSGPSALGAVWPAAGITVGGAGSTPQARTPRRAGVTPQTRHAARSHRQAGLRQPGGSLRAIPSHGLLSSPAVGLPAPCHHRGTQP